MPIADFMEAMVFYNLWPFGEVRQDLHMAVLASTVANASGNYRRKITPKDFMLFDEEEKRSNGPQTPEQMHANFLRVLEFAKRKAKGQIPS